MKKKKKTSKVLNIAVSFALGWETREANTICTVVVDGVSMADPTEPSVLEGIKILKLLLVPPSLPLSLAEPCIHWYLTSINVEALVRGYKGSLGPVCLLQATPCGPVVCVPEAWIYLHGLVKWESYPQVFVVLEHPYWHIIHKEPASYSYTFILVSL